MEPRIQRALLTEALAEIALRLSVTLLASLLRNRTGKEQVTRQAVLRFSENNWIFIWIKWLSYLISLPTPNHAVNFLPLNLYRTESNRHTS